MSTKLGEARWLQQGAVWAVAGVVLWLVVWPFLLELSVAVDDVQRLLTPTRSLSEGLWRAWHERLFRPPIVVSSFLVDAVTRRAPLLVLAQSAALLLALVPAVKLSVNRGLRPGLAVLFWLLQPAVTVSLWQTDTLSQTLCALVGLWLFALATGAWRPRFPQGWWILLVVGGLLTKETFLGWVAAALLWDYFRLKRLDVSHAITLAIVLAYLSLRLPIALGEAASAAPGLAQITHLPTLVLGLLTFGPVHLLRLTGPSSVTWWLSLTAPLLHVAILAAGARESRETLNRVLRLWGTAFLVLTPVLIMPQVSELYLMGPNFLTALALAECLGALFLGRRPRARAWATVLVLLAVWGMASRSYHFALTWRYSSSLAQAIPHMQTPLDPHQVDPSCSLPEHGHSVYFVSPVVALCVPCTAAVAAANGQPLPQGWEKSLDCSALPKRKTW